jgi:nucleotide-binding universal stress UspA family protein
MPLIRNILVATDFSPHADAALAYGADLAQRYAASLLIVHVYANPVLLVPDGIAPVIVPNLGDLIDQIRDGLRKAEVRARELGAPTVETRLVEGTAWYEIVAAAKAGACDLVVMGTHGRSGLSHLVLGSVAEKVVRKAPCSVLAVHLPR